MTLNGWQRLWVVASVLLGIAAIYLAALDGPSEERIESRYRWELRSLSAENLRSDREIDKILGHDVPATTLVEEVAQKKYEATKKYNDDLETLPVTKVKYYVAVVVGWAVVCGCLYLMGWAVGWIIRGFRRPSAS